jgi:very-short-patch-repair endonuclease
VPAITPSEAGVSAITPSEAGVSAITPSEVGVSAADRFITSLARRQHGVVCARQLRVAGISPTAVRTRLADGRLRSVHRGVYTIGPLSQRARWMAAVLAIGPHAYLSHRDAAALHGLRAVNRGAIDVTVSRRARSRRGITVHETRDLPARDRTTVDGIAVTSISRTLLDLAELLPPPQLRRAYEQAERLRVLDLRTIQEVLERANGRRAAAGLRALVAYDPATAAEAQSELELRFIDLVRGVGLPAPQVNVLVEGFVVDAHWPSARLVVELQGYAYHSDRQAFERDHARLARLKLAGYEVLALTWRQVMEEPAWVVEAIRTLLDRSARDGTPETQAQTRGTDR